jgi:hypothetical protein
MHEFYDVSLQGVCTNCGNVFTATNVFHRTAVKYYEGQLITPKQYLELAFEGDTDIYWFPPGTLQAILEMGTDHILTECTGMIKTWKKGRGMVMLSVVYNKSNRASNDVIPDEPETVITETLDDVEVF